MTDIHWFSQNQKVQAEASIIVTPVLFWFTQCEKLYLLPLKTCLCCGTELFERNVSGLNHLTSKLDLSC